MVEPVGEPTTVLEKPTTASAISEQALAHVEAERVRGLMKGMSASSAVTVVIVLVVTGDADAARLHALALAASAVACGALALWWRGPGFSIKLAMYLLFGQVGVLLSGFYFWGVFSAYGILLPLTVYIAAGAASRGQLLLGVGTCCVAQTGFALATSFGWIESRGLVEPVAGRTDTFTEIIAIALIQVITIGAAAAGRAARRDATRALEAHDQLLLELARRDAQLAEAYADARAMHEQGVVGRFTEQVIDDFHLGEVLGRGSMGEVYAARRGDDAALAMKILSPHLLRDRAARERFLRESEMVGSLQCDHIVRVVAVAPAAAPLPYIVMERLAGIDLAQLIKKQPLLPLPEIARVVTHVAKALDEAHAANIVHRDLKPSNIYATGDANEPCWKLLDFGASKWRDGNSTLTRDQLIGTPGYMSPEQALGRSVDARADIYAFGVILYRLITGVPAVVPGEIPAMLQEVCYRMPVQPSKRTRVLVGIEDVLAVALAKTPAQRFASAGALATAFHAAAAGRPDAAVAARADALLAELPWDSWRRA